MKKGIMISAMIVCALSLTAIGIVKHSINTTPPVVTKEKPKDNGLLIKEKASSIPFNDFALDVGPRFLATVSKADLSTATSISDIIPADANWDQYFFSKTHVRIVKSNMDIVDEELGYNLNLTDSQVELLNNASYSDDLQFGAEPTSAQGPGSLNYMVTVVPEKQTAYKGGNYELISHLRNDTYNLIALQKNKQWDAGKIKFTVDVFGVVTNVNLISSSGDDTIDQQMIRAISDLPDKWTPAENTKGEKVEQVLTLSFGSMGC